MYRKRVAWSVGASIDEWLTTHWVGLSLGAQITTAFRREKVDLEHPLPYQWLVVKPLIIEILDHLRCRVELFWLHVVFLLCSRTNSFAVLAYFASRVGGTDDTKDLRA
jgi:hypothetical protein